MTVKITYPPVQSPFGQAQGGLGRSTCTELRRSKHRHTDPFGSAQGGLRGGISQAFEAGSYFNAVTKCRFETFRMFSEMGNEAKILINYIRYVHSICRKDRILYGACTAYCYKLSLCYVESVLVRVGILGL